VPAWSSVPIVSVLGVSYALVYVSGLGYKFSILLSEMIFIIRRFSVNAQVSGIDFTPFQHSLTELFNSIGVIFGRVFTWVVALAIGEPTFDPVAAGFVWIVLVWIVAAWAGWVTIAYKNALFAILPAILLSVGALSFGQRVSFSLYLMLGLTLLLLAIVQHDKREREWEDVGTAFPPRKGRQVGYTAILISIAVVLLAAAVSSISIPRIVERLSTSGGPAVQGEGGLADSLGIVSRVTVTPDMFEDVRNPGLPRDKLIGSGPELSKRIVMTVAVDDFLSIFEGNHAQPLYWRSFTYDQYTGHGWRTSNTTLDRYDANELLQTEQAPQHLLIDQVVRPTGSESHIVYAAGEPVAVNSSSEVVWRSSGDMFGIMIEDTHSIEARSLIPVVDEKSLQEKGQNYPDWVRNRYLHLPPDLPNRVNELALQLTAPEPTPYDRVRAIEQYLRTIPYTLDVPYPPLDKDLVDFFLFDLRQGYCDYYASAMVVMARAAGVPARLVTGYASGTYDLNSKRFMVSEADAHSWVEVYFPEIGWVPFEPTAGRPSLDRSQQFTSNVDENITLPVETPGTPQSDLTTRGWLIGLGLLTSFGALGFAWLGLDEMRLRSLPERTAAKEVFLRLRRFGEYFEVTSLPGNTPYEIALLFRAKLQDLSRIGLSPVFKDSLIEGIATMTDRIVEASYQPNIEKDGSRNVIVQQWKRLRWRLLMIWVVNYSYSIRDILAGTLAGRSNGYITEQEEKE
jgi:transglutaminase-like putative cysteine protease